MVKGGKRPGAGRPAGSGKWGEQTVRMRIPASKAAAVEAFLSTRAAPLALPLYTSRVQAGFPSPADDYIEARLDLNQHLIQHPAATFFVRAQGDSMRGAGIHDGDLLIVDRSLTPRDGSIVIAAVDGDLTVKTLTTHNGQRVLRPENPDFPDIPLTDATDCVIWGVVTNVVHHVRAG